MEYDWQNMQSRLADSVRNNPVPLALIGLGLGWLMVSGMRGGQAAGGLRGSQYSGAEEGLGYGSAEGTGYGGATRRYSATPGYAGPSEGYAQSYESTEAGGEPGIGERARAYSRSAADTARQWRDRAAEVGTRVGHRAQEWASSARERASSAGQAARAQASQMADRSLHTFQEHPIMIGSVALLVGAAIGASLPRTRREDQLLGQARDDIVRQARESGVVEKVKHVGERAVEAAREGGAQAFERVKGTAKEATSEAYQHVREAAREEAERQDLPGSQGYRH